MWPTKTAVRLNNCTAIIQADPDVVAEFLQKHRCTAPIHFEPYTPGAVWLEGLLTGADELNRFIATALPGGHVADCQFVPIDRP